MLGVGEAGEAASRAVVVAAEQRHLETQPALACYLQTSPSCSCAFRS